MTTPLFRTEPRVVAGVCQGLATHLGWSVRWIRIGFVVAAFCYGAGILFYIWCWIFAPKLGNGNISNPGAKFNAHMSTGQYDPEQWLAGRSWAGPPNEALNTPSSPQPATDTPQPADLSGIWRVFLLAVFAVTALVALQRFGIEVSLPQTIPLLIGCVGVAGSWSRLKSVSLGSAAIAVSVALVAIVIGFALFIKLNSGASEIEYIIATLAAGALLALATGPWVVQLARLASERKAQQAAESAKVEVAAHLHDSVLQTLALIQQRSDPHSEVARLARHQEQSLRDWLVDSEQSAGSTLKTLLSRAQTNLESQYAVRFELVTVGSDPHGISTDVAAAAATEAMRNAAAHAGGDITVFAEASASQISIKVIDRGPGVDLDAIPANHFGIRESIIARSERAGGTAEFSAGPGGHGTKVSIVIPRGSDEEDG